MRILHPNRDNITPFYDTYSVKPCYPEFHLLKQTLPRHNRILFPMLSMPLFTTTYWLHIQRISMYHYPLNKKPFIPSSVPPREIKLTSRKAPSLSLAMHRTVPRYARRKPKGDPIEYETVRNWLSTPKGNGQLGWEGFVGIMNGPNIWSNLDP